MTRLLEGPLDVSEYEGQSGSPAPNHGLPRFAQCSFAAAYPLGQVMLSDPDVPLKVRLEAFNPLIPGVADDSGIPVAVMRYVLINRTAKPVQASVCGSLLNFIGNDGKEGASADNVNGYREGSGFSGLFMKSRGVEREAAQWGTMALATTSRTGVTRRTAWKKVGWGSSLLDFWDDFRRRRQAGGAQARGRGRAHGIAGGGAQGAAEKHQRRDVSHHLALSEPLHVVAGQQWRVRYR